jgi:hypothetical protein
MCLRASYRPFRVEGGGALKAGEVEETVGSPQKFAYNCTGFGAALGSARSEAGKDRILSLLTAILSREGYQVYQARSGETCRALHSRKTSEVVLIDFHSPDTALYQAKRQGRNRVQAFQLAGQP